MLRYTVRAHITFPCYKKGKNALLVGNGSRQIA
jgi:hypothetical protein